MISGPTQGEFGGFYENHTIASEGRQPFGAERLDSAQAGKRETERPMWKQLNYERPELDAATSASVREGIGERLRDSLPVQRFDVPSHLQNLLDEMKKREFEDAA